MPQFRLVFLLALSAAGFGALPSPAQPAFPLSDLNTAVPGYNLASPPASRFVVLGSQTFFTTDDGLHGLELWQSDGTEAGTRIVRDICPGRCSSSPGFLTVFENALYFAADDGVHGAELWKSDGTEAGTLLVQDSRPGLNPSFAPFSQGLFVAGGTLFLTLYDPSHGCELWASDGTASATFLLRDIDPVISPFCPAPLGAVGDVLLFAAESPLEGRELWRSDGTSAGTYRVRDIAPGSSGSSPSGGFSFAGKLYFGADDGTHGQELWASDGTEAGTQLVRDLEPGSGFSLPWDLVPLGDRFLFVAQTAAAGRELWISDGTSAGTRLFADLNPGAASANPAELTRLGDRIYFPADDGVRGRELWATDGTPAGPRLVHDVWPGPSSGLPILGLSAANPVHSLTAVGSKLVFFAEDGSHGREPWASDGTTAGTALLADLQPGSGSSIFSGYPQIDRLTAAAGQLLFQTLGTEARTAVWTTDGTSGGTRLLQKFDTQRSSFARFLAPIGGKLYFAASDGSTPLQPWVSDGTPAGTFSVAALPLGLNPVSPAYFTPSAHGVLFLGEREARTRLWLTRGQPQDAIPLAQPGCPTGFYDLQPAFGGRVFFGAACQSSRMLWTSDGSSTDPLFSDIEQPLDPRMFSSLGQLVLFAADLPLAGPWNTALWVSDGTRAGTYPIEGLDVLSAPFDLTPVGGRTFFSAFSPATGQELWISDGTPAGTRRVKDIRPGFESGLSHLGLLSSTPSIPYRTRFAALGNRLVFLADDGTTGEELWISDGTEVGTRLIEDLYPGLRSSEIRELTAIGDRVYFVAEDGVHGRELWISDGTSAGTRLVRDFFPGPESGLPRGLTAVDGILLFAANDGIHGVEPWRSTGSAGGTYQVQDIAPGSASSSPESFSAFGSRVGFVADDGRSGIEPWALPRAALARFSDVPPEHPFWAAIEALAASGITAGCGNGAQFCPDTLVNRAQMSVFLGRAIHGADFLPPAATGTRFTDVPASYWAADWIEQIARDGVTLGCNAGSTFCPEAQVLRSSMAIFLLRAKHGAGYVPPPATGTRFSDVPAGYWAAAWIEQLAAEGITAGCGGGKYCPEGQISRSNLAAFLVRAFGLLP